MLSGINPILGGVLLAELDRLGHGDELVVADANFPAHRIGLTVFDALGTSAASMVEAIRSLVPLDTHGGAPVLLMAAENHERLPVQHELIAAAGTPIDAVETLERFAFYERAASSILIVRTGELRPFGNVILRKGVVNTYTTTGAAR